VMNLLNSSKGVSAEGGEMVRIVFRSVLVFIALLLIGGLTYRSVRQHRNAKALAIRTSNRIEESMFVQIGGIDQWVQIRGENRDNPVLLILHGGPGSSYVPFTPTIRSWERYFTVVQWDQRGAGKTYGRNDRARDGDMTIDRMVQDGIEVTEFVRKRLHKKGVILLGHSWGTILGVPMVQRRADLFYAYVGTGQIVDMARNEAVSYDMVLKKARATTDEKAIKELERIGPPPYKDLRSWAVKQRLIVQTAPSTADDLFLAGDFYTSALYASDYSLKDTYDFFAAIYFSSTALIEKLMSYDARLLGVKFKTPIFFFQGDSDVQTPTVLVDEYLASIEAPKKELVLFRGCGHMAVFSKPDVFLNELVARVRPLALDH
jgi:pimeloyl-ACP methyl ester carboxylesterase